jgi:hypothetical protein
MAPLKGRKVYSFEVDVATPSNNSIRGLHFHAYKALRKSWAQKILKAIGTPPGQPIETAWVRITRYCSGSGLDWDNAYGGLKPLLDCLVSATARNPSGLGLIRDDNPRNMPVPPLVLQVAAKRGKSKTLVEIFSLDKNHEHDDAADGRA